MSIAYNNDKRKNFFLNSTKFDIFGDSKEIPENSIFSKFF